jgi:sortase A
MKLWRYFETGTLVAGLLGVSVWLGSIAESALYQRWQNWAFDHQLQGQPAGFDRFLTEQRDNLVNFVARPGQRRTVLPPAGHSRTVVRLMPDRSLVGRLTIPRLHLTAIVREGIAEKTLRVALGHVPGTALPGMPGNVGVAGHRDRLFRPLRQIRRDDLIRLESLTGTYLYRVEKTEIVWPRNVSVLEVSAQPHLTLVTCYPFYYVGAAPKRFIVTARQISAAPRPVPKSQQHGTRRTDATPGGSASPPG